MKPFLYHVAQDLIRRYGNNLSEVTIVFPGKRAELYINTFLSHIAQGPVWAPRFITIDELFQQFSDLIPADPVLCVCRLYNIYKQLVPTPLSLDDFYGWGEVLVNDFSDIDKHLAPAEKLFANASDLTEMERTDFLQPEQQDTLRQFFAHFDADHQSELKERFLRMWKAMPQMYAQLKSQLRQEGLMYKGGLYREVVESLNTEEHSRLSSLSSLHLHAFVGFNVLDEVEEALFSAFKDAGQALFYWDYDVYYTSQQPMHEAGLFLRHNLEKFPSALSADLYDNFTQPGKQVRILSASTDNAQVRYLPQWLTERKDRQQGQMAIVLCDETMMRPAMHSIPNGIDCNLTMGFPLTDTAISGYFSALIDLQVDGYDADSQRFLPTALERLEGNPFFSTFPQPLLPLSHQPASLQLIDWMAQAIESLGQALPEDDALNIEATFQFHRLLGQFRWLVSDGLLNVRPLTLRRLLRQALASASIPFHGQMDQNVQVMGLLEARALDFPHLIMLGVGEGILPRKSATTSFIPYILRSHFGLDTTQRQDAVYAYSFYRLLQRSTDITLIYNNTTSGASQREKSRFLRQLIAESPLTIEQRELGTPSVPAPDKRPITIDKDDTVMQRLLRRTSLSPTAINQYIQCPMLFYYQQVANLRMPDRPQDGIDVLHFGTLFHDTCQLFYTDLTSRLGRNQILASDLEPYVQQPQLRLISFVDQAFETNGFPPATRGTNMLIRDVIIKLVAQLLNWDLAHTPFTFVEAEKPHYLTLDFNAGSQTKSLKIGGIIDRMDIMSIQGCPTLRIVDYKTGKSPRSFPPDLESIFQSGHEKAQGYYLQTFLYSIALAHEQQLPVAPCLFYVLSAGDAQRYDPTLALGMQLVTDIREFEAGFMQLMRRTVEEIYDPSRPFVQIEDKPDDRNNPCKRCDFRALCNR